MADGATSKTRTPRTARLEVRTIPDVRDQIERAAALQGRSVSDFVVTAALEAARREIAESGVVTLSLEAYERLCDAVDNPPPPTEGLHEAFALHRKLIARNG